MIRSKLMRKISWSREIPKLDQKVDDYDDSKSIMDDLESIASFREPVKRPVQPKYTRPVEPKYKNGGFSNSPTKVFIVWVIFVSLCNIYTPYYDNNPTDTKAEEIWPPTDLMLQNIDNHNRVVTVLVEKSDIDLVDNFLYSLESFKVNNFVIVPLDLESSQILEKAYPNHVLPPMTSNPTKTVGGVDSSSFKTSVQSRIEILLALIKAGYKVFYNDVDSVWRTNVFTYVDKMLDRNTVFYPSNVDAFFTGDATRKRGINPGHMYLKPTPATEAFLELWLNQKPANTRSGYELTLNNLVSGADTTDNSLSLEFDDINMNVIVGPDGKDFFNAKDKQEKASAAIVYSNVGKTNEEKMKLMKGDKLWNPSGRLTPLTEKKA